LTVRIVITAPDDPATRLLTERLRERGVEVQAIPLIEIRPIRFASPFRESTDENPAERLAKSNIQPFDWLFFTSRNGVRAFFNGLSSVEPCKSIPIAVVGPATARTLGVFNLQPTFISPRFDGESAANAFLATHTDPNPHILWPCGDRAHSGPAVHLTQGGCRVTPLIVYHTLLRRWDTLTISEREALQSFVTESPSEAGVGPSTDSMLVFTSPSAVEACERMLPGLLASTQASVACLGPRTAEELRNVHARVTIQPESNTFDALCEAIQNYLL
jgi:uroporphyrinogen III methyltransferase/synthase